MRTTIDLPDVLLRRAKRVALERGKTLKELFIVCLEAGLAEPVANRKRMTAPPIGAGISHTIPALTNAEIAALLETDERL